MKDFIETDNRRYHCTLVQKEIRFKGKAYIILRELRAGSAPEAADTGAAHLRRNGAREIFFTCRDNAVTLQDAITTPGGRTFRHVYDMDWLEKDLADLAPPETGLSLQLLGKRNSADFLRIYNECFFGVPNGATYTHADVRKLLAPDDGHEAGLVLETGQPVGTWELSFGEAPEIQGLGITDTKRGLGYGRQGLGLLLGVLRRRGCRRAGLLVCTANEAAYGLYLKCGFEKKYTQSRWYRMD